MAPALSNRGHHGADLRADGSILDKPGYDEATGLLFEPCGVEFPAVPSSPGPAEAEAALVFLRNLFSTFSFVADEDLAVVLSGLFTALVRRSLPAAPLHGVTSPVAGSGKSMLVDLISIVATGKVAPVIAQGRTDEEMQKRLGAALIAGDSIISIDNCGMALGGDLLCQAMTQQMLRIRLLGQSRNIDAPSNACLFATGNNLAIAGDMTRRALLCSLDPKVERPELLSFSTNPLQTVRENRGAYVVAALTIMRAHHLVAPPAAVPPLGSFERWSRQVRDALMWLGLPDPCSTIEKARRSDPDLAAIVSVVEQWHFAAGTAKLSVKQLVEKANEASDLKDALAAVAGDGTSINNDRLGKWLGKKAGRVVTTGEGLTLRRAKIALAGVSIGKNHWRIEMVA